MPILIKTIDTVDIYRMDKDCKYEIMYLYNCPQCGGHTWFPHIKFPNIREMIKYTEKNWWICHICNHRYSVFEKRVSIEPKTEQLKLFA